jgi:uncharacterized protein (DUF1800 family)
MPDLNIVNTRHLLRRTEFVDRSVRVTALLGQPTIAAAVDSMLAVDPPLEVEFAPGSTNAQKLTQLTHFWLDQMAGVSLHPVQERMALFWHGLFCSGMQKVVRTDQMNEQINLFRRDGLGNVRHLVAEVSTQVAMLRYLDNNQNKASSPNENFARELMELFLLGVGNYSEADVQAATLAWTGHTEDWQDELSPYRWKPEWHDSSAKSFLGTTINAGGDPFDHAYETIEVILGNGTVPQSAMLAANRGRSTREVAAEYLSTKLWANFAGTPIPPSALALLRDTLLANDFDITPWVRALLTCSEFYSTEVRSGLVRSPVEYVVALLVATGRSSAAVSPLFTMTQMGQRLFYPPDVSGWKTNGYWVNPGLMEHRARGGQYVFNQTIAGWGLPDAKVTLPGGEITKAEIWQTVDGVRVLSDDDLVDRLLEYTDLVLSPAARAGVVAFSAASPVEHRIDALKLIMLAPELHLA